MEKRINSFIDDASKSILNGTSEIYSAECPIFISEFKKKYLDRLIQNCNNKSKNKIKIQVLDDSPVIVGKVLSKEVLKLHVEFHQQQIRKYYISILRDRSFAKIIE